MILIIQEHGQVLLIIRINTFSVLVDTIQNTNKMNNILTRLKNTKSEQMTGLLSDTLQLKILNIYLVRNQPYFLMEKTKL